MNEEDSVLWEQLISTLQGGHSHMSFDDAVKDFPMDRINDIFPNGSYSAWGLLEHIRRTQADILEFITNPAYKEKEWPKDYWPEKNKKATKKDWDTTIQKYHEDLDALVTIIKNQKTNLFEPISYADGQTILREIMLIIYHTSYEIGEFAIMRQVMGTW